MSHKARQTVALTERVRFGIETIGHQLSDGSAVGEDFDFGRARGVFRDSPTPHDIVAEEGNPTAGGLHVGFRDTKDE
ncbi:hypothetical protein [Thiocystis violascens]|uniref:hypothetical protein n=1 Tax=Thiocystis violascens TaxID=73141 RepID=UPI0012F62B3F|nr:hypothetical protein [Thiocystis violascens]